MVCLGFCVPSATTRNTPTSAATDIYYIYDLSTPKKRSRDNISLFIYTCEKILAEK